MDKYGKDLHGIYVFGADSKSARDSSFASLGGLRDIGGTNQGIKSDGDFNVGGRDPQSAYTPFVQQMAMVFPRSSVGSDGGSKRK